jgi:hypothetical protein
MSLFRRSLMVAPLGLLVLAGCLKGGDDVIGEADRIAPLAMGYYDYCQDGTCTDSFLFLNADKKFYTLIKDEEATTAEVATLDAKRILVKASNGMGGGLLVGTVSADGTKVVMRQPDCDRIKGALEPYLNEHKELHADDDICQVNTMDQAKKYIALVDAKAPGAYDPAKETTLTLKRKVN